MIIVDTDIVKVGGVILPGIFQKLEIDSDVKVDEVDVKGKSVKPKQATGYEDAKIKLVIGLRPNNQEDEFEQLSRIQNIFKRPGQEKPKVYEIFNKHLNTRGITRVIFKKLTSREDNNSNIIKVVCEFWEYIPITIRSTKTSSVSNNNESSISPKLNLINEYETYLEERNSPIDKSKATAAIDDDIVWRPYYVK
ncbi:hypothetical protein [Maledivibacter halophilus]|uniref:Uncharacterized protein n=1 Tax=Maledivibacter halophilus TaxID=36842 RepID=A0A1T5KWS1_9FIRM|nr:hypothetical protein [Maledivibacter halophilus]SKC68234.1 hypothetical protein SAMN02194393_02130 [Maledivibacter halophilus]SKC71852.1 hypothetical protein SAMN02194393_02522 [Maledivibacter halophilus]SKC80125.1 hypothetical protein SAMN02194393_03441 [Maledivibacter halophilus]